MSAFFEKEFEIGKDHFCRRSIFSATKFQNGLLSGNSSSSSNPVQSTSSTGGASSPSTSGSKSPVNTGSQVTIGKGGTLVTSDPQVEQSAFDSIVAVVKQALDAVSGQATASTAAVQAQSQNQNDAQAQLLQAVLTADQANAANVQSGGQTDNNSTLLKYAVLAFLALFGISFLRSSK